MEGLQYGGGIPGGYKQGYKHGSGPDLFQSDSLDNSNPQDSDVTFPVEQPFKCQSQLILVVCP